MVGACTESPAAESSKLPDKEKPAKPNVLFILADDMTYEAIHSFGNDEIITPNLDRLVSNGTAFTHAYNMGGWHGAVSVASRSMLLTGMYMWHSKEAQDAGYSELFDNRLCWSQVMKNNGYDTYMTGKWHVDHITPDQVFDEVKDVRKGGMPGENKAQYNRPLSEDDNNWLPWDKSRGGYWAGGTHWSEVQAADVVEWLDERKDEKDPFFMYVAFNAPHDPRQSPKEYVDKYDVNSIKVPLDFVPEHPLPEIKNSPGNTRDEKHAPFPRTEYAVRKHRQEYYAIVTHLDTQIGKIMDELEKTGLDKNTIVVFAADNGLTCGHHGLMGKQSMYEEAMRVPLVFCGKGVPAGVTVNSLVYMHDLVPTIYEMVGIKTPPSVEYKSLKPLFTNPGKTHRNYIYGTFANENQRMICDGKYKLFFIPSAGTAYFFDLQKDPHEMNNLFEDPAYLPTIKKMAKKYLALAAEAGDPLDIKQYYPELFN